MSTRYELTLPLPMSTNRIWRHSNGKTYKAQQATNYAAEVGYICRELGITPIAGAVSLTLYFYFPNRRGDLSNRVKLLEDALQGYAYHNDSQVACGRQELRVDKRNPRVEVVVEAIEWDYNGARE